jgi:hypothetical protein
MMSLLKIAQNVAQHIFLSKLIYKFYREKSIPKYLDTFAFVSEELPKENKLLIE